MFEIEGYSHYEIGQMLGITASSSRSNLTRAKKMLRELYIKNFNTVIGNNEAI
jgi:RNA polymerase sigma-70 factor (ECF subfamily)